MNGNELVTLADTLTREEKNTVRKWLLIDA